MSGHAQLLRPFVSAVYYFLLKNNIRHDHFQRVNLNNTYNLALHLTGVSGPCGAVALVLFVSIGGDGSQKFGLYFDFCEHCTGDHTFKNVSDLNKLLENFLSIDKDRRCVDLQKQMQDAHAKLNQIIQILNGA
jgi:hypothetical protein